MIVAAVFLATTNKILIDAVFKPLKDKYPSHDFFWLFYVSLLSGGAIGWFSEGNLFVEFMPNPIVGRVLTAVLIGGGASLIHELFGNLNTAIRSVSINNWSQAEAADATTEKTLVEVDKVVAETAAIEAGAASSVTPDVTEASPAVSFVGTPAKGEG